MSDNDNGIQAPAVRPPWDSVHGMDLLIGVPVLWIVEVLLGIVLIGWAGLSSSPFDHPIAVLAVTCFSAAITLSVTWALVCRKYRKSFFAGFLISRPDRRTVVLSLLMGGGYALIAAALMSKFSTGASPLEHMVKTPVGFVCFVIMALLLPPVEEIYYRGFIFPAMQTRFGSGVATVVVIVWFGAAHAAQLTGDWIGIPIIAVAGALWTIQRLVSGSLTRSILTHWTYNLVLVLTGVLEKALK